MGDVAIERLVALPAGALGVCGLNVDPYAGEPATGRVRHLYVLPALRGRGVGARLVAAVVAAARGRFERLRLSTRNPEAARLYERLGFRACPGATAATHARGLD